MKYPVCFAIIACTRLCGFYFSRVCAILLFCTIACCNHDDDFVYVLLLLVRAVSQQCAVCSV